MDVICNLQELMGDILQLLSCYKLGEAAKQMYEELKKQKPINKLWYDKVYK